jgi:hypothetical protein
VKQHAVAKHRYYTASLFRDLLQQQQVTNYQDRLSLILAQAVLCRWIHLHGGAL